LGHLVAQPFQGRPQQGSATVAIVDELKFGRHLSTIGLDPLTQRGELTGDGAIFGLLVARDSSIRTDA
jgi:hypothetical protein